MCTHTHSHLDGTCPLLLSVPVAQLGKAPILQVHIPKVGGSNPVLAKSIFHFFKLDFGHRSRREWSQNERNINVHMCVKFQINRMKRSGVIAV